VIRDRLVYKTVLSLVTIAVSGLIRLVFSILVGRVYGAQFLGHVNVVISSAVFATLLCSPGLGQAVARHMAGRDLDGSSAAGRTVLVWATAANHIVCLFLAIVVAWAIPANGWSDRVLALALTLGYGAYTYYKAVLYGVDLVERYAVLELSWDGLFVLALVGVLALDSQRWVLAPLVLVYLGFSVGAHLTLFRRHGGTQRSGRLGTSEGRSLASFAAVTAIGTVSSAGFLQLSQVFALRAGGTYGAGLFAAAMTLVTPAYLLPRAISVVLFPAMARAAGREDRTTRDRQLVVGTQVLAAAILPLFALVSMVATGLITLIYGPKFSAGGPTLVIMIWATWVSIASVPAVNALSSDTSRAYVVPAAASVAGFLLGVGGWLVYGTSIEFVAWGYLIGSVVQSAIPMIESWRRYGAPGAWLVARVTVVAIAGLATALAVSDSAKVPQVVAGVIAALIAAIVVLPELRSLARTRTRPVAGW
jgi:O-antigen/teichoic acid export membrane protein